jgi:hypothetical protein
MKPNEKSITVTVVVYDGQEKAQTQFYVSVDGCNKLQQKPRSIVMERMLKALEQVAHQINMNL